MRAASQAIPDHQVILAPQDSQVCLAHLAAKVTWVPSSMVPPEPPGSKVTKASQGSQVKSVWGPQEEEGQTEPLGIQGRRVTLVLGPPAQQADKGPQGKKVLLGLQVIWGHRVQLDVLEHLG